MNRLPRPAVPIWTQCEVASRQLGVPVHAIAEQLGWWRKQRGALTRYLKDHLLPRLRSKLGVTSLHLDHDPALENRRQIHSPNAVELTAETFLRYDPDANDPAHLIYREGGFRGSAHDVKTRVRGERGQFADNVIAKRARRRAKKIDTSDIPEVKKAWFKKAKVKWPKGRKLKSRNNLRKKK